MARTPEGKAKDAVDNLLDAAGCYWFCPTTGGYGKSGLPDRVACHKGSFIGVEVKADTEATALQLKNLDAIAAAGGISVIVRISSDKTIVAGLKLLAYHLGVDDYERIAFATRRKKKPGAGQTVRV